MVCETLVMLVCGACGLLRLLVLVGGTAELEGRLYDLDEPYRCMLEWLLVPFAYLVVVGDWAVRLLLLAL